MSARYISIKPMQEPYDLGLDDQGRSKVQFNITARKDPSVPSGDFAEELVKILGDAGVVISSGPTRNVSVSTTAKIPDTAQLWLSVIETSGAPPEMTQNQLSPTYLNPTALIVARAADYVAARDLARAAYNALAVIRNQTITV